MKIKEEPVCLDIDMKIVKLGDKCIHTTSWGKSNLYKGVIVSIVSSESVRVMTGFTYDYKLYDKSKNRYLTRLVKAKKLYILD